MGIETVLMAGAAVAGSAIQAGAAGDAADAQAAAANQDIAFQTETRDIILENLAPFLEGGTNALDPYLYNLGLLPEAPMIGATPLEITEIPGTPAMTGFGGGFGGGGGNGEDGYITPTGAGGVRKPVGGLTAGTPTQWQVGDQLFSSREEAEAYARANATGGTQYQGFQESPGYQWQLEQGLGAVNALAGARGGLDSGRTREDLMKTGMGLANQDYWNYMTRLGGLVDTGMGAATISGNAGQNAAAGVSNALAGFGNAQAAGAIGAGNAWNSGINNALGIWQYQNAMNSGINPYATPYSSGVAGVGIY